MVMVMVIWGVAKKEKRKAKKDMQPLFVSKHHVKRYEVCGIAQASSGEVVTMDDYGALHFWSPEDGNLLLRKEPNRTRPKRISCALRQIATDPRNHRLVSVDTNNYRVVVFEEDGTPVFDFGSESDFDNPSMAIVDPATGHYLVSDNWGYRGVQRFDQSGRHLLTFENPCRAHGIAILPSGLVAVANLDLSQIILYTQDGKLHSVLETGPLPGLAHLVVTPAGNLVASCGVKIMVFGLDQDPPVLRACIDLSGLPLGGCVGLAIDRHRKRLLVAGDKRCYAIFGS